MRKCPRPPPATPTRVNFDHGHVELGSKQLTTGATSISAWYEYEGHTDQFPILLDLKVGPLSAVFIAINEMGDPGYGKQTLSISNRCATGRINSFQTPAFKPAAWNHVVGTYDGGDPYDVRSYKIYVNGRRLSLNPMKYNGGDTPKNVLGWDSYSPGKYFIGSLSELLVYDTALSAGDVAELYRGRHAMSDGSDQYPRGSHLVAGYHFGEGRGTITADFTSNGNDGTLKGGVKWVAGREAPAAESKKVEVSCLHAARSRRPSRTRTNRSRTFHPLPPPNDL